MINERAIQEGSSRRNEITREDALTATRHFFNTVNERRTVPKVPVMTTTGVSQVDTPPVSHDPVETEPAEPGTPQTYFPNGSPPILTVTATYRPQTWEQRISEGHIEEHSRKDKDSVESAPLEPLVLEGPPDELGPEWIQGVRFPTDDTPPNHRRLAESDALVNLIQMAEYLEDVP